MRVEVIEAQVVRQAVEVQPQPLAADVVDHPAGDALPLARMAGLLGSGVFALGASLTCFTC